VLFAAMRRQPAIKIFGSDYPTPDGTCIRDYVHVSDLADAHVAALDWLAAGQASSAFNLGKGRGFSVADVVRTVEQISGLPIKRRLGPRRFGDPPVLISDPLRHRNCLGGNQSFPISVSRLTTHGNGFAMECRD
jgi:UDP-glucose 4-epimerase